MSHLFYDTGVVSTLNTSTTPLLTGTSFTGEWEPIAKYATIVIAYGSDQPMTVYAEWSTDGVTKVGQSQLSATNELVTRNVNTLIVGSPYFRIRVDNAGGDMTTFNTSALFHTSAKIAMPTSRLSSTVPASADALVVRSMEEESLLAEGKYEGRKIVNKFGRAQNVSGPQDVWPIGGFYTGQPITGVPETITVTSSAGSADAGLVLTIQGLDGDYVEQDETITLDANGIGTTTLTFWRAFRAFVRTPAAGQVTNVGVLNASHTTTVANVFFGIPAGVGQTQVAVYTVPAGYTAYVRKFSADMLDTNSNSGTIAGWVRSFGEAERVVRPAKISTDSGMSQIDFYGGIVAPEKTDMRVRVLGVQNAQADVTAAFDLVIVRNS